MSIFTLEKFTTRHISVRPYPPLVNRSQGHNLRLKLALLLFFCAGFYNSITAQTLMPLPAFSNVYTGDVRGYWFTAPTNFTITGLKVPADAGTGAQYIQVIKILDASPVLYPTTSTNFTTLAYISGATNGVIQAVNIPVNNGDIIGILGYAAGSNSYSVSTPYASNINGLPATLNRLIHQGSIMTAQSPDYSTEASGSISRVEMYYTVNTTPCNGQPVAGVATGPSSICPNIGFSLVDTGFTTGTGLSYQWESSPSGAGVWTAISGATTPYLSVASGITTATDYRFTITCNNGGATDISNTLSIAINAPNACYCTPGATNPNASDNIMNVTFAGINNSTGGSGVNGYNDYTTTISPAQVLAGLSYPASMTINSGGTEYGGIWIDWDQSGTFDTSEFVYMGSGSLTPLTSTINVPLTAVAGTTRMRVRSKYGTLITSTDPCTGYTYGETEDYLVNVTIPAPCSGTPVAGSAFGPDSICANSPFTLTDTAFTAALGITYQWEESPAGAGVWTAISGATNPYYTVSAGISAPTDYHMVITCTNGGATDVSNTFTVNLNSFYKCYCSPLTGVTLNSNYSTNYITNVTIPSTTLNATTTASGPGGYMMLDPTISGNTGTLIPGLTYTINASIQYSGDPLAAWIDYDQSGTFDTSEYIPFAGTTATFTVPVSAVGGTTGLRIRNNDWIMSYSSNGACSDNFYGETEDYMMNIATLTPCSGTPAAGTIYGPDSVCANISFTVMDTAFTIASGMTFQWESAPAGSGVWTAIPGATSTIYTESAGIITPTDYHLIVTCSNGGGSDISNTYTANLNAFYKCYCSPLNGTVLNQYYSTNYITNVTIPSTTLNATTTASGPGGYMMLDPTISGNTGTLIPGLTYTINASIQYSGDPLAAWIDYDQSGTFDTSEYIPFTGTTATFTVPLSAVGGNTGLRVRNNDWIMSYSSNGACSDNFYGETEDYIMNVATLTPCSGTPAAGTIYGPDSVCANASFSLMDTAFTIASGLTFQWESAPAGSGVWTAIPGATGTIYTESAGITAPTDYHLIVTCSNGGATDISNTVTLYMNTFVNCYCTPGATSNTASDNILNVTFAGINNTTTTGGVNGYVDYTASVSPALVSVGVTYPISMIINNGGTEYGGVWIDWDQSGTFDTSEFTYMGTGATPNVLSQTITVPATAVLGTTRMRVRSKYGSLITATDPCSGYTYGETEDYLVNVTPPPTCVAPTSLAATNVTAAAADLSWIENGTATQWSIEYGPTGFTQGTGTFVSTTTNPFTLPGLSAGTTYDVYVKCICSTTDSSFANGPVSISTDQIPVNSYPYAINWDNGGGGWTYANGSEMNKWYVGAPGQNPANAFGPSAGGLYISDDGGLTNNYASNTGILSTVHAYRDLDLTSFSAAIPLSFNSYVVAEVGYDSLSVWIVPITYDPTPGTLITSANGTQIGSAIYGESGWTQHLLSIPPSYAGTMARLVLQWHNDPYTGTAPVKVDNLTIGGFPLVIKLKDISATNLGAKNRVDWSTESELKSDKFELERSADGRNFTYLATIKAKGEASNYSYVDLSPVTGVNYYRLKMIDAAGSVATSKVVTAIVKQGVFTVEAYPNPVTEKLTVQVYGGSDQNATVVITDVTGKVMKVVSVVNGKAEVNMSGLASGVYLVKYTDNNHSQTIKVNKQ